MSWLGKQRRSWVVSLLLSSLCHYPPTADLSKAPELITIIAAKMSLLSSFSSQFNERTSLHLLCHPIANLLPIFPITKHFSRVSTRCLPNWFYCAIFRDGLSIRFSRRVKHKSVKSAVNHLGYKLEKKPQIKCVCCRGCRWSRGLSSAAFDLSLRH